ncbi:enolase C-terminal domain-like protein [Cohnella silvisoli]|uniref:Enolase C-terminal domain-like protein n=1 Tax=Cohnella silvisoli TaxID=2873699 RepID=A0ABV1KMP1_9BACL|nr:enolase C-terminal domain-like protein [Cohnella silvisoli]MCD9020315.1 galactonate dehydratase [Cohnella silvisoli]
MKITELELLKVPPSWVWVRIHTDCGITGLGEPYLEDHPEVVMAEVNRLAPFLIGEDPTRLEYLWRKMYESGNGYKGGPVKMSAISGIDMALWDITGKAYGLPVHKLLGGKFRDRVKVYRSCHDEQPYTVKPGLPYRSTPLASRSEDPADGWASERMSRSAEELVKWGFRCLKLHFGPSDRLDQLADLDEIKSCVAAVREAVGGQIDIAVDIHNTHMSRALQLVRRFEPFGLLFVEEPLQPERIDLIKRIVDEASMPIAAGERWMGKWAFREALEAGVSVVQPDLAHAGGFTELRKIAAMAEASYASIAPHCPLSALSFAASVQFGAAIPNFLIQEHNEVNDSREAGVTRIGYGYMRDPFKLGGDGCVQVPDLPGIGFELDESGFAEVMKQPWRTARG